MILVFLAAIIFGFVHPGSKILLSSGIDLLSFCLLYVGIRLIAQVPIIIKNKGLRIENSRQALVLLSIGMVGAVLQMSEFMGIAEGLPVPVVTFFVYTHPVWTILLGRILNSEKITSISIIKLTLGISGTAFIFLTQAQQFLLKPSLLIAPILAGFMIALWITLSGKAKKENINTWTISFYYDLFAFLILILVRGSGTYDVLPMSELVSVIKQSNFLISMIGYSIFIGLLPNLLFYHGSKSISALGAGLILLLEPIMATLTSSFLWNITLAPLFMLGAMLVLLAGAPIENIQNIKKVFSFDSFLRRLAIIFIVILSTPSEASTKSNTLHVLEVVPSDEGDYTNSKEMKAIDIASDIAISDFKTKNARCTFKVNKSLLRGSEEILFQKVSELSKAAKDNEVVVGLTRSSFARVAATAAKDSKLKAISVGAATANLADINKNFVSVAAPWTSQWEAIEDQLSKSLCTDKNIVGFFDTNDYLSRQFSEAFESKFGKEQKFSISSFDANFKKIIKNKSCIFLGVNFSKAQMPLTLIAKEDLKLTIVGIGDWNYYAPELRALLKNNASSWNVLAPTGWIANISANSKKFSKRFENLMKEEASPIAAYTYDATLMALYSLCKKIEPNLFTLNTFKSIPNLLRSYKGLAASNNFKSEMQIIQFKEAR